MPKNYSPWIHQLDKNRAIVRLTGDLQTDIAIVGAGIAGVSTAFFLLKYTDKKITLIDANRLAHGATGHNAGHVVTAFERRLIDMAAEFGEELTAEGYKLMDGGWELLDEMYKDSTLDIAYLKFAGYGAIANYEYFLGELLDNEYRRKYGLETYDFFVSKNATYLSQIPQKFRNDYKLVDDEFINKILENKNHDYSAMHSYRTGCINSALFCESVVNFLLKKYSDRFSLYEHTPIRKIVLRDGEALLDADTYTISSKKIVLCTNGFESIEIFNKSGLDIDTKFHHLVNGYIGYMSGYFEELQEASVARYYIDLDGEDLEKNPFGEPYFYVTRRPFEYEPSTTFLKEKVVLGEPKINHSIVCVGGPESELEDRKEYDRDMPFPENVQVEIDTFVKKTLLNKELEDVEYKFFWHGLMGYTPNRVRLIGCEPKNPVLLYNLGCNGIGILPSIYGGKRISQIIAGEKLEPSIFDPKT